MALGGRMSNVLYKTTRPNDRPRMFRDGQRFHSGIARVRVTDDIFELAIGNVAVVLDRRRAQAVVGALTYALLATAPAAPPARPVRKPPRPRPRSVHATSVAR